MMSGIHKTEESIFFHAIDIENDAERSLFVQQACAGDKQQVARIERLLRANQQIGDLLDIPDGNVIPIIANLVEQTPPPQPPKTLAPNAPLGGTLGDFQLVREIGRGGMGVVYEAHQISLNRQVALKVLPFTAVLDQRQLERFKTEAQAAAGLHHGNIVPVFHIGRDRAVHYYAMQYIEGQDVSDLIKQLRQVAQKDELDLPVTKDADFSLASELVTGRFEPADLTRPDMPLDEDDDNFARPDSNAVNDTGTFAALPTKDATNKPEYFRTIAGLGIQGAEALEFAHQNGILHRDIKPSNLMLDAGGKLWVTDFGLARIEGDAGLTTTGDVMGTLRYMSPEQATGQNDAVDRRSDLYSLGVTLYEMLSLSPVYPSAARNELLQKGLEEEPSPLRQVNNAIPADLETIIHKAIAKEPADRYATAQEFADDLRRYLNGEPIHARRPSVATRISKWAQRNRTLALSFAAAFIGGIVAAAIVVVVKDRDGNVISQTTYPDGHAVTIENENTVRPPEISRRETPSPEPFAGLLPDPPALPGIARWQIVNRHVTGTPNNILGHFAWSPDGRYIAVPTDEVLRVYEFPSFELKRIFCGHTDGLTKVDWSPNGKLLATASNDDTVRIWDFETGTPSITLFGNACDVRTVKWHPNDGKRLVSGNVAGNLRMWSREGKLLKRWRGHPNSSVWEIAWSPDGKTLASAGADGTIALSNDQGALQSVIDTKKGAVSTVAWSPDGKRLLTANRGSGEVCVWKRDGTPGPVFAGHTAGPMCAAWSPDGQRVASVAHDGKRRIWDVDTGAKTEIDVGQVEMSALPIDWVAWRPGSKSIATFSNDGFHVWDASGGVIAQFAILARLRAARLSPDGQKLAANIGHADEFYMLLCNSDGTQSQSLDRLHEYPLDFAWTPDSHSVVVGGWRLHAIAPLLRLCGRDGSEGPVIINSPDVEKSSGVRRLSVSPHGNQVAVRIVSDKDPSLLQIWNLDGTPGPICEGSDITKVRSRPAWSPQGNKIAMCDAGGTLRIWKSEDGQLESSLITAGGYEVVWKPDGTQIAVVSSDFVQVWGMDGLQIAALRGGDVGQPPFEWATSTHVKFSENYSKGQATSIRYRDPRTGRFEWILAATRAKQFVKFAADGRVLDGNPDVVDREFVCVVQQPNGAVQILKPSGFRQRYQQEAP
ncbi:Serine/threonine-protein kinase PknB [Symmachiella macrocystis]|uniref:Serine/threonine-protein kinase PknB n=1 Tax=Symmachiella macrocystis TaxID=2527985 RepID=A0A5C6BBG0_9PLAN|nr:protein kinase [Symmachiella macrocystis]TWU08791.1 Serine/threonine-protein kinase PknB [Symmachiella macrocystis]